MKSTQKIVPNLWFDGSASEAVDFYTEAFGGEVLKKDYYPHEGLLDFQKPLAGEVLTIDFKIKDQQFVAINAGPDFTPNASISFMVNFDPLTDQEARNNLDLLWNTLMQDGEVLMPLQKYDFSEYYGWVKDKYGITWQLILTDPEGEPRPHIIPSFMFGAENVNKANEAIDYYVSVFKDSNRGESYAYGKQTGPATADSLMFADFTLAGQWFAANDSAVDQDFTFNEGISLMVNCKDQAEIDYFWEKLSADSKSEQCGWCKDRFGVSWQIVPQNMEELMNKPGAFEKLLQMKKIEIEKF
jgi:predicted 3-demethylubiquinone-9 3-methyltransferase (glyoxalase superfamily)